MRFTLASVAFFAGLAIAAPAPEETVYETQEVTITSCAPEVTDCPGLSTGVTPEVPEETYAVPSEVYPEEPEVPSDAVPEEPEESVYPTPSSSVATPPEPTPEEPAPEEPIPEEPVPEEPNVSVVPITTCIETVIYETITVSPTEIPAETPIETPVETPIPSSSVTPSASYSYPPQASSTSTSPPVFTGAASNVAGSVTFAGAAAALIAFLV